MNPGWPDHTFGLEPWRVQYLATDIHCRGFRREKILRKIRKRLQTVLVNRYIPLVT